MIDARITKARSALIIDQPFFGSLAMRLQVIASDLYETMATDGVRMFYNAAFLDTISARQLMFVIAHEVMHCAMNHHTRRGNRDVKLWNIACDHVINLILKKAGFDLPDWVYCDRQYEGLGAEAVFKILDDAQKKKAQQEQDHQQPSEAEPESGNDAPDSDDDSSSPNPQDEQGEEQDGDGKDEHGDGNAADGEQDDDQPSSDDVDGQNDAGEDQGEAPQSASGNASGEGEGETKDDGPGDPGGCGQVLDAAPEHDEGALADQEAEWEVAVRQAVNIAKKQNAGTVPGFLEQVVADLADPRTDWREVLRRFVDPSNTKDYSWINPNRRLMSQGYFNPGLVSDGINHVAVIVDSSSSCDDNALRKFGGEAQATLDEGAIDKLTLLFADTRVCSVAEYGKGDVIDFTVRGRGGTRFAPAFEWLNENAPDISAAIYLTDLDCSDFGPEPSYPVLWAAYGDPREIKRHAEHLPFGECVELQ